MTSWRGSRARRSRSIRLFRRRSAGERWASWNQATSSLMSRARPPRSSRSPHRWTAGRAGKSSSPTDSESSRMHRTSGSRWTRTAAGLARTGPMIRTTEEIRRTIRVRGELNHHVALAGPVQYPDRIDLPIEPYTLGAWLGDGTTTKAEITCYDEDILANVSGEGYAVRSVGYAPNLYRIGGVGHTRDVATGRYLPNGSLHSKLRSLGLMDGKFVPRPYLESGVGQRLALLQGLMDTDGYRRRCRRAVRVHEHTRATCRRCRGASREPRFPPVQDGRASDVGWRRSWSEIPGEVHPRSPGLPPPAQAPSAESQPMRGSIDSAPSTPSGRSLPSRSAVSRWRRLTAYSSYRSRSSRPTTAPSVGSGCSSTRRPATSTRAGRAT